MRLGRRRNSEGAEPRWRRNTLANWAAWRYPTAPATTWTGSELRREQLGGVAHPHALELAAEAGAAHLGQRALELAAARGDLAGHAPEREVGVAVLRARSPREPRGTGRGDAGRWMPARRGIRRPSPTGSSVRLAHVQVRTGMSRTVVTVAPGATLKDAASSMAERKVGAAVVIDPEQPGPGIITERDLLNSIADGQDPTGELVQDHLSAERHLRGTRLVARACRRGDGPRRLPPPRRGGRRRDGRRALDARHRPLLGAGRRDVGPAALVLERQI